MRGRWPTAGSSPTWPPTSRRPTPGSPPTSTSANPTAASRPLEDRDWLSLPDGRDPPEEPEPPSPGELRDGRGRRYRLAAVTDHRYGRQTRWLRRGARGRSETVTLRTVIGALETYEPARAMTRAALARAERHAERRLRPSAERWRTGTIPTVGATSRIWACFRAWTR